MRIKYDFSLSQDWSEDGLKFTECVCKRHNLDMIQLLDIFNEFALFTSKNITDEKEIVYWLAQNERTLAVYGEGCIDSRTVVLSTYLDYNVTDDVQELANKKYGVGFDNEHYYELRAEITAYKVEE